MHGTGIEVILPSPIRSFAAEKEQVWHKYVPEDTVILLAGLANSWCVDDGCQLL